MALRVGWVGFHEEGIPALEALLQRKAIVGVMTLRPEKAAKRSAVADVTGLSRQYGIEPVEVAHINDADSIEVLRSWRADVIFVIGWSQILSKEALECARIGTFGAHASFLPHNRGSAPINWALIRGEQESGNSLMWLADDVDNGDLLDQEAFAMTPYDTCATLYEKVAATNKTMILAALEAFERGERPRRPQGETDEPILPRRRPRDGRMDWTKKAGELYNFVRALTRPYPGAFTKYEGKKWLVWQAVALDAPLANQEPAGTVVGHLQSPVPEACGLLVACGEGVLGILEMEGPDGVLLAGPELCAAFQRGKRFDHE